MFAAFTLVVTCTVSAVGGASAQANSDYNVTVNLGPKLLNANYAFSGQSTSLRVALANHSTSVAISNAAYIG